MTTLLADDLVVIDACGSNRNLTPRYARVPRGQRAVGYGPRTTPPNTTVIASLTITVLGPAILLPGATDRLAFEADVEQVLAPSLQPGQMVLLETLSAHRSATVAHLIAAWGCHLWFLPSYSPDVSPIELAFAKLKQAWRQAGSRTIDALYDTLSASLPMSTAEDARNFFIHCGYHLGAPG